MGENREPINQARYRSGLFVGNEAFQTFVIFIIILNSVMMGIGTFDFVTEDAFMCGLFEAFDKIFLLIFTVEVGFQLIHHGFCLFKDGFLTFDLLIVIASWVFQPIQAFRIIRAVRIVSRIKAMRETANALVNVIPSIRTVGLILLLIFYMFGVMFTQLFKHLWKEGALDMDYFSRLDRTFFTLFQLMTLQSWSKITKQVMVVYPWAWLPFITFVLITHFVIVNLIAKVQKDKMDDQLLLIKVSYSESNTVKMNLLERKIDNLAMMMELLEDKSKQKT